MYLLLLILIIFYKCIYISDAFRNISTAAQVKLVLKYVLRSFKALINTLSGVNTVQRCNFSIVLPQLHICTLFTPKWSLKWRYLYLLKEYCPSEILFSERKYVGLYEVNKWLAFLYPHNV